LASSFFLAAALCFAACFFRFCGCERRLFLLFLFGVLGELYCFSAAWSSGQGVAFTGHEIFKFLGALGNIQNDPLLTGPPMPLARRPG
jgi:hypothetical protein